VVDSLAAIGSSISAEDHIDAILDGLPEEYDSFVMSVTSQIDPYIVQDIESLLMAQEDRFDKPKFLDSSSAKVHFSSIGWVPSSSSRYSSRGGRSSSRAPFHQKRQNYSRPEICCSFFIFSTKGAVSAMFQVWPHNFNMLDLI